MSKSELERFDQFRLYTKDAAYIFLGMKSNLPVAGKVENFKPIAS